MRILVATDQWFPDLEGGVARVAAETARRLAGRGHEVTVLAPRSRGVPAETREGSLTILSVLARRGLPQTLADVLEAWQHGRRLRSPRFDVLLAHQSTTAVGLRFAHMGAPLALVFHASATRELRFRRSRSAPGAGRLTTYALEPLLAALERSSVKNAATALVLSEYSRSLLHEDHDLPPERVIRVSGGVDVGSFCPTEGTERARARLGAPPGMPLLLTVRRLEPRMGLEVLLEAVARLRPLRDVAVAIVGAGSLGPRLRSLSAELGLGDRVLFPGRVSDEDLHDWYRAADLFVLPTVAYEGFGMATLEALASGTPVVGTPVGATPELLRPLDPRLLARGHDPETLAAAIGDVLDLIGPELRRRCRDYAVSQFSWDHVIGEWERALADVVAPSTQRPQAGGSSDMIESADITDSTRSGERIDS